MSNPRLLVTDFHSQPITGEKMTANGYLVTPAIIARSGVQDYLAWELFGFEEGKDPERIVRLYRPEREVFADDAMASFERLPVTSDHPFEDVVAGNWEKYAVGSTEGQPVREGALVKHQLIINKASAVNDVQRGKRELSCGWSFVPDMTPGVTDDNEPYDLIAREIRGNHIAIVDAGRCGPACRAGDSAKSPRLPTNLKDSCKCEHPAPAPKDAPMTNRTLIIDSIPVELSEQAFAVVDKLQKAHDAMKEELETTKEDAKKAKADADKEKGAKDAEIAELKAAADKAPDIDALVIARGALLDSAKPFLAKDFDFKGKSEADIHKAAVIAQMGEAAVADMTPEGIAGAFSYMAAKDTAPATPTSPFVPATPVVTTQDATNGQAAYETSIQDAWRGETAQPN